jgi:hypothetical protein
MQTKVCNKCHIEKTIDLFSPNQELKFKVTSECKQCRAYRKKHGHYPNETKKQITASVEVKKTIDDKIPDLAEVANFIDYRLKYEKQTREEFLREIGVIE